jgi:hypothetical protein
MIRPRRGSPGIPQVHVRFVLLPKRDSLLNKLVRATAGTGSKRGDVRSLVGRKTNLHAIQGSHSVKESIGFQGGSKSLLKLVIKVIVSRIHLRSGNAGQIGITQIAHFQDLTIAALQALVFFDGRTTKRSRPLRVMDTGCFSASSW